VRTRASATRDAYARQLNRQFREMIDGLALGDLQKRFLHSRWLDQLLWFEARATTNQRRYYGLRLVTIVGGVIVPALISLNLRTADVADALAWVTFGLSLAVAISAALESFFGFGERWQTFRRTAEALKGQGWLFFELTGPYQAQDHAAAFPTFAAQVETLVRQDVEAFIAQAQAAQQLLSSQAGAAPQRASPAG
jgi:Protein of unknown function (DUF4231)